MFIGENLRLRKCNTFHLTLYFFSFLFTTYTTFILKGKLSTLYFFYFFHLIHYTVYLIFF